MKLCITLTLILLSAVTGFSTACTSNTTSKDPLNTVHLVSVAKIKGLDPALADDLYAGTEVSRAYESLLQYHYLKRPYQLIPNLAESMPEISADGKTYTIRLKKGVLFQDDPCFKETGGKGREMTAEDVLYSWKRVADPKTVSTGWWIFDNRVVGLNQWREEASQSGVSDYSKPIEGFKIIDRYTLQIKLVQRSYIFLYNLAQPFSAIIPHEAVEMYGKELINHAVGTGPFRLREYNPNSKIVWDRNPTYRKELYPSEGEKGDREAGLLEDAGKPLPLSDRLVTHIFVEQQPMWLTFLSGKLDVSGIPKDSYAQAITPGKDLTPELKAKGITLHKAAGADVTHETFNMADPLIGKNKYLRQALSHAIDWDKMLELFYNNRAISAQGPVPPGLSGYDPHLKNPYKVFSVSKAKELLAKAGYPGGKGLPVLEYNTIADSTSRQMNEFISKSFKAIGVEVKFNGYSWPEFSAAVRNRRGQIWGMAWNGDYPDAENFLALFYGKNVSPGSNDSNYSNPVFDRLYEKALLLPDGAKRNELYHQMVQILVEDAPWIFGVHRMSYGLVHPWLKNYKPNEFEHCKAKYYRVDPTLKK